MTAPYWRLDAPCTATLVGQLLARHTAVMDSWMRPKPESERAWWNRRPTTPGGFALDALLVVAGSTTAAVLLRGDWLSGLSLGLVIASLRTAYWFYEYDALP